MCAQGSRRYEQVAECASRPDQFAANRDVASLGRYSVIFETFDTIRWWQLGGD
jgi:hypothetical protein